MSYTSKYFSNTDGLTLHARLYEPQVPPLQTVVCLAGLTRNARDFDGLAMRLMAEGFRVIAMESKGRGKSHYAKTIEDYNVVAEAQDVLTGLAALGVEHGAFIGTSRGGLILHLLAGMRPTLLKAVILNDIGPVIEPDGLLQIRRYLENAPQPKSWDDALSIQKTVHGKAFPILTDIDWARHARAIYKEDAKGNVVANFDPKIAQTLASLQADTRLPALWPQFAGFEKIPMMVIRGEHSRLLSEQTFQDMGKRHPNCKLVTAHGQGHAPLLDVADLPDQIVRFLNSI